jgi:hypothetical protein
MQKNRGVKFILGRRVLRYKGEGGKVEKIEMNGKTIDTDYVLYFPNNVEANLEYLNESTYAADMHFDSKGRVATQVDLNTNHNKIFAAGECAAPMNYKNSERFNECSHGSNVSQGMFAAYNILGLGIPYMIIPFVDYEFYGHRWREAGSMNYFEDKVIEGDLKDFNFTAWYVKKNMGILRAAGFQKKANDMSIVREALRTAVQVHPDMENPLGFSKIDIPDLEKRIRAFNKSGCYRKIFWDQRFEPVTELILWDDQKMRMGDAYFNFWEHGYLTAGELMRREEAEQMRKLEESAAPKSGK